jgi:hypothetical protein
MDDPNERPDRNAQQRMRIRDALIGHGLVPAHAETLAKGLVDLVTVIGPAACTEAFAIALGPETPDGETIEQSQELRAAGAVLAGAPDAERVLGAFVTELKRLDEALQLLTTQLGRLRKAAPVTGTPGSDEKKTLH